MAIVTGDFTVSAKELVVSMKVVHKERLFPVNTRMASVALVASMLVMRVILQVTGGARAVHLVLKGIF